MPELKLIKVKFYLKKFINLSHLDGGLSSILSID